MHPCEERMASAVKRAAELPPLPPGEQPAKRGRPVSKRPSAASVAEATPATAAGVVAMAAAAGGMPGPPRKRVTLYTVFMQELLAEPTFAPGLGQKARFAAAVAEWKRRKAELQADILGPPPPAVATAAAAPVAKRRAAKAAAPAAKAEPAAAAKAAPPPAAEAAAPAGPGCTKCRHAPTGCRRCNPGRFAA
jgi:hypothetical protein